MGMPGYRCDAHDGDECKECPCCQAVRIAALEVQNKRLREDKSRLVLDNTSWESTCDRLKAENKQLEDELKGAYNVGGQCRILSVAMGKQASCHCPKCRAERAEAEVKRLCASLVHIRNQAVNDLHHALKVGDLSGLVASSRWIRDRAKEALKEIDDGGVTSGKESTVARQFQEGCAAVTCAFERIQVQNRELCGEHTQWFAALQDIASGPCCETPGCSPENPLCQTMMARTALKGISEQGENP